MPSLRKKKDLVKRLVFYQGWDFWSLSKNTSYLKLLLEIMMMNIVLSETVSVYHVWSLNPLHQSSYEWILKTWIPGLHARTTESELPGIPETCFTQAHCIIPRDDPPFFFFFFGSSFLRTTVLEFCTRENSISLDLSDCDYLTWFWTLWFYGSFISLLT